MRPDGELRREASQRFGDGRQAFRGFGGGAAKIVLAQGKSNVNGPHQGAWVDTPDGRQDWFLHFQDQGPYGRVVHLQPMSWKNDWPVIGSDADGNGVGEPVLTHRKPAVPGRPQPLAVPATSDEFTSPALGLQWQWHANSQPGWALPTGALGFLRLNAVPLPTDYYNLWQVPNLLLQKLPAAEFTVTTKLIFTPRFEGERLGLLMMGLDYAALTLTNLGGKLQLAQSVCKNADQLGPETTLAPAAELPPGQPVYLRVAVQAGAKCQFSYSLDSSSFRPVGTEFVAREGKWIGAKVGLFCTRPGKTNDGGTADISWFRVE